VEDSPKLLSAALVIDVLPVIVRSRLQYLVARGKSVDQLLIVGTGDLQAKLSALGYMANATRLMQSTELERPIAAWRALTFAPKRLQPSHGTSASDSVGLSVQRLKTATISAVRTGLAR